MPLLPSLDTVLKNVDTALRSIFPPEKRSSERKNPGQSLEDCPLSSKEKRHTAGLMRVNHSGEVCAQALYQGQALTAKLNHVRDQMAQAAEEEVDHLAWCEQRLQELDSKPSVLNPIWYTGSLMMGMLAGLAGDKWSLGFVAETERQVTAHLESHMQRISQDDKRTKAILDQMKEDETKHAETAVHAGAAELPWPVKKLMQHVSKIMTRTSYMI